MSRAQQYRDYLVKKPGDRFAQYSLALELKKSQDSGAEAAFQELVETHPKSGAGWYQYGELFREREDFTRADQVWRQGLAALQGVNDADTRRSKSEIQGELDEIEDELD